MGTHAGIEGFNIEFIQKIPVLNMDRSNKLRLIEIYFINELKTKDKFGIVCKNE